MKKILTVLITAVFVFVGSCFIATPAKAGNNDLLPILGASIVGAIIASSCPRTTVVIVQQPTYQTYPSIGYPGMYPYLYSNQMMRIQIPTCAPAIVTIRTPLGYRRVRTCVSIPLEDSTPVTTTWFWHSR